MPFEKSIQGKFVEFQFSPKNTSVHFCFPKSRLLDQNEKYKDLS